MAKLIDMQNGKVKVVRGRFGGDNKRASDYDTRDRLETLGSILEREGRQEIIEFGTRRTAVAGTMAHACIMSTTDEASAFSAICEVTGQAKRPGSVARLEDGDVDIKLTYGPDGRIQCPTPAPTGATAGSSAISVK